MLTIHDYSNRRGVLVPLLPKVHALLKELAERDKHSGLDAPENIITWQQKMKKELVDINRRFFVAASGENLAGIFFYLHDAKKIFLEDVQVAWIFRNNSQVMEGFLKKLEFDKDAKDAVFFAGERIRIETDKEILAAKGLAAAHRGFEELGNFQQMSAAMKLRYNRG